MSDYGNMPPPPPPPPPSGGYEQPGYGAAPTGPPLASWIQRVGAALVDYALILPFSLVRSLVGPKTSIITQGDGTLATTQTGGNTALALILSLLIFGIWLYNRWYLGGRGQSLGKRALGLTLMGESTGQPIGMLKAFLRDVAHFVDGIICFVGYLFPLWDKKRQTIADKILSTVVTAKA